MLNMVLNCTSKGDRRFHPGALKITIGGRTDTIDGFFNSSLRNRLGEECGFSDADHFSFGGCDFPLELCESFYLSLWLQRIMPDRFLQSELKKYSDFFDGREDGVNSHARAFRYYLQGGTGFLKGKSSAFLNAYGKAKKNIMEDGDSAGTGDALPEAAFPEFSYIEKRAEEKAGQVFALSEHSKEMCSRFVLKDFGFPNSKDINVFDREQLHNLISSMAGAYYELLCGDVNKGYVNSVVTECSGKFADIKAGYKTV